MKRMRVLVLTDKYYPKPYANAVCAQALIKEFNKKNIDITVLAYKDCGVDGVSTWEGNPVIYVKPDLRQSLFYWADNNGRSRKAKLAREIAKILNRVKKLFLIPWQPMYSLSMPYKIRKVIENYYDTEGFDAIVSILNPFELSVAACRFRKKHPAIPVVVYAVDTLRSDYIKGNQAFANGFFWEKRLLKDCSAYFYMKARKEEFSSHRYDEYRKKLVEVDLPRLEIKDIDNIQKYDFDSSYEHWVYAGSIGGIHYAYEDMLSIFETISSNRKCILHMYIRGAEADRIKEIAEKKHLPIIVHGYVAQDVLESIMASCDVLVTLKSSNHISAKIFECISYQKPIVHFSGVEDDPNAEYYVKCAAYKVVKMYSANIEAELIELEKYLDRIGKINISKKDTEELYYESTPKYSVKLIIDRIKEQNNGFKNK